MEKTKRKEVCFISKKEFNIEDLVKGSNIRPGLHCLIKEEYPEFDDKSFIHITELKRFRIKYLENLFKKEMGEISKIQQDVIDSISKNEVLSATLSLDKQHQEPLGTRISDLIAKFGGSWTFIISFLLFCSFWMMINVANILANEFDPYPFILLNLILSCIAAIQAPVILMSQNRQEQKDRKRAEHDYKVNLKAELEIRLLHEKIDYLLGQQNQRFIEIQQLQMDLMEDILTKVK